MQIDERIAFDGCLSVRAKARTLVERYGSIDAACYAVEDRIIRCKRASTESRLMILIDALQSLKG